MKTNSIIDKSFGKLTVLEESDRRTPSGTILYKCICECNKITYASRYDLTSGHKASCGCTRKEKFAAHAKKIKEENNLIGQIFTNLKVVSEYGKDKNNYVLWYCECKCGGNIIASTNSLKSGNTKSCGCLVNNSAAIKEDKVFGTSIGIIKSKKLSTRNKSGYRGVSWDKAKNKWRVTITFQGKYYHLAYEADIEKAVEIRKIAEEKIYSKFLEWYYAEFPEKKKKTK